MGNLCSKRKNSDSLSVKSEGSVATAKQEGLENHSASSKRPSQQNGTNQGQGGPHVSGGNVDASAESSGVIKDHVRVMRDTEPSSVSADSMSLSSPTALTAPRASDGPPHSFAFPLEMRKQTENVRNLLVGRVSKTKPVNKGRKMTLYICTSSSQDFRLEKGNLHTEVYPALREYCSTRGYELHITDLHWKTDLETRQDHLFPELCLEELKRQSEVSYVIPVLFLSNSLGAPLLPKSIEQQDFEMALKNIGDPDSKDILEKWYSLDTHAQPPCYQLNSISTHIPNIGSDNEEEKSSAITEWRAIVEQILSVILRVFPTELRDTYLTTVIEQEIHNSIFMSREVGKRSIWAHRVFTHIQANSGAPPSTPIELEKNRRLESLHNELKSQLGADHILRLLVKWHDGGLCGDHPEHSQYLKELSNQLTIQLKAILNEIIDEDSSKVAWRSCYGVDGALCSEVMQHTIFCQQAAKCSVSGENVLNSIKQYIGGDKTHPLVIHGAKGCGKRCLLSRVVQQCATWYPDALIVFRFVGLTPESRSLVQILRTVTSQLAFLLTGRNYWIPHNVRCYRHELYKMLLSKASPPLVLVVVDGLDELNPFESSELEWLSEDLAPRMKLILSCAEDSPVFQSIKVNMRHDEAFISMSSMAQQPAESLLTASILQYSHSADAEVQKKLCTRLKHCTLPLYIKVLAWQASIDSHAVDDVATVNDVSSAINGLFDYLEKSLGKEKVEMALALICSSRFGICDSELLDLLACSSKFCSSVTLLDWAPASLFLAQLCQSLGPFIEWGVAGGAMVTRWRDSALVEIVKKRYIGNKDQEKKTRQMLLDYFQGTLKDKKQGRHVNATTILGNRHHRRKLEEIPFQQLNLKGSIKTAYLCNVDWLLEKLQVSDVYNVIEDITLETQGGDKFKDSDLSLLLKTLELSASALSHDGKQFFGQMYGRLLSIFQNGGQELNKCPFVKSLFDRSQKPTVQTFLPISQKLLNNPKDFGSEGLPSSFSELDNSALYFDEITRLKTGNQYVVSLSASKEEVVVWNVYHESPVRTLKGVVNPNSIRIIDDKRVVILCGRELSIFNLDDGTFVSKLKGVMNQKMPFFGLHDENHVVALSRNRMYVNLMNLESGDCVTTFKVGEDRFLNSLIVSENGKILVCGDETQKPFPLLVWDLTSRKLLYDLRIPHNEFLTQYSAITKEGNFVCCVCREVEDSGPNYIVVYDLQSGTLFKKWKPGSNTQAIAISAQGGCVINAIEDNRILVWDLVTGACQWSLEKHTAPVDNLKLDLKGSRCLSCDSTGRDRTVCLWDISNGTLLALFTPDIPFSSCEVSNDGDGIILGLRGRPEIATLLYRNNATITCNRVDEKFGDEKHHGKITDLQNPEESA